MRLLLALLVCASLSWGAYGFKRSVTVNSAQVSGTSHTDFPVLVSVTNNDLRTAANGGNVQDAEGDDIGFFSDSGLTTALAWDMVSYSATTGAVKAYVKIPTLSGSVDTVIYMGYGDAALTTYQSTRANVWTGNVAVLHLQEDPSGGAPQFPDRTGNANNGTSVGSMTSGDLVAGNIANAIDFDGTDDYLQVATASGIPNYSTTTAYAVSFWVKGVAQSDKRVVAFGRSTTDTPIIGWGTSPTSPNNKMRLYFRSDTVQTLSADSTTVVFDDAWHHIYWVDNAGTATLYVDGVADATSFAYTPLATTLDRASIGTLLRATPVSFFTGQVAFVRFRANNPSADWIATEYACENAPGTFLTLGSQEAIGGSTRRVFSVQ